MSWIQLLQPDLMVRGTILSLSPDQISAHGLRGLILDVDETLLPSSLGQVSPEMTQWIETLKPDFKIWLVTNNLNQPRIKRISEELGLPFYFGAGKPSRRKLRQAMEQMGLPAEQVGVIGDRLFTDVLAGNRLGLFTILVDPVLPPHVTTLDPFKHPKVFWIQQIEGAMSRILGVKLE